MPPLPHSSRPSAVAGRRNTREKCSKPGCKNLTGGSYLSAGTDVCPGHADLRLAKVMKSPEARKWVRSWNGKLETLERAGRS
jgi:hypothetical protein